MTTPKITYTHCIEQINENGEIRYEALINKSVWGGIDGPFTDTVEFPGLVEAMASPKDYGFTLDGHYKITPRYGSFDNGFFAIATLQVAA